MGLADSGRGSRQPPRVVRTSALLVVLLVIVGVTVTGAAGVAGIALWGALTGPHHGGATPGPTVSPALTTGTGFLLYNTQSRECADLPGTGPVPAGTVVSQYTCVFDRDTDNQYLTLVATRAVQGKHLYQIRFVTGGLCLDLPGGGADAPSTQVIVYPCADAAQSDNQEWYLQRVSGDNQQGDELVNYASGLCLDVTGGANDGSDTADNLPLTIYPCYDSSAANAGYDDHIWQLLTDLQP